MDDGVSPLGVERAGNGLGRIVVRVLFLLTPQLTGVDQRADGIVIPEQRLGLSAVEAAIGAEVPAAFSQRRGLGEGGADHRAQGRLFRHRSGGHLKRHWDLILGIGDQMQPVAEPTLDGFPGLAGGGIDPVSFVMTPIGIGFGGLSARARFLTGAVTGDVGAIEAEMLAEVGQHGHELLAQHHSHLADHAKRLFQLDDLGQKARDVPARGQRAHRLWRGRALNA